MSGSGTFPLDCDRPPQTLKAQPEDGTLVFQAHTEAGTFFSLPDCGETLLDLVDACGRHIRIYVELTYNSEGMPLTLTCPKASEGGSQ